LNKKISGTNKKETVEKRIIYITWDCEDALCPVSMIELAKQQ
jgi:hypothetical protein